MKIRTLTLALFTPIVALAQTDPMLEPAHHPIQFLSKNSSTPTGYTPAQVRHAYGVDQLTNGGEGQTIGIVDSNDYPAAEADLNFFSTTFGLPQCTVASGCLTIVYANGVKPPFNRGATGETSLDLQWAHAIAPNAKLLLVETAARIADLLDGVPIAAAHGASVVSMSWGTNREAPYETSLDAKYFSDAKVTYFNASGDNGNNLFGYPGASPLVVGAGGTTLKLDSEGNILSETAWRGSGGGESLYFAEPAYQVPYQSTGQRGVPDVAWDSNPFTGIPVYDSDDGKWGEAGGTSCASPQWAALTAIANSMRAEAGKGTIGTNFLTVIYQNPTALRDITQGSNGKCGTICDAGPGYDFVTGLGSPMAPLVVAALVAAP